MMRKLTILELEIELRNIVAEKKKKNPLYSARAFAKALGFSDSLIYKIINNERHLSKRSAKEICKVLGYELVDDLEISAPEVKSKTGLKSLIIEFKDISDNEFSSSKNKINSFIESLQVYYREFKPDALTKLILEIKFSIKKNKKL